MIKLPLTTAIVIYIFVYVIAFLLWWVYTEFKKSYNLRLAIKGSLWECAICTYVYPVNLSEGITICPRCGSYNEKKKGAEA